MMRFIFITNSPELAAYVVGRGVDRVMVDLELLGKVERQGHLSTVISRHDFDDIARVRAAIPGKELMVRLNPVNDCTEEEVDRAVELGADVLMLPMFRTAYEVERFCAYVSKRARVCLLLETAAGASALTDIIAVSGVDEVHIGLNDLHLDLGHTFMFEPLAYGLVDDIAGAVCAAGLPLGIGGLARAGEGLLPADMLLAEHVRLHSTGAILSRTFHRNSASVTDIVRQMNFAAETSKLQKAYEKYRQSSMEELLAVHHEVAARVAMIVQSKPGGS
jgi:hypothetical protein